MTDETPRALFPAGAEITAATPQDSPIFFGMAMNRTAKLGPMGMFRIEHATFDEPAKRKTSYAAVYMMTGQALVSTGGNVIDCLVPVAPIWDGAVIAGTMAPVFEKREPGENVAVGYLAEVFSVCDDARTMLLAYRKWDTATPIDNACLILLDKLDAVLKPAHDYMKANGKGGDN